MKSKTIFIALLLSIASNAADWGRFYFDIGYPYWTIAENQRSHVTGFAAVSLGGGLEFHLNDNWVAALDFETLYTPIINDFALTLEGKRIEGTANVSSAFYNLVIYRYIARGENFRYYLGLGPSIATDTINFEQIKDNETRLSKNSRLLSENKGARVSFKATNPKEEFFYELVGYYVERDSYSILNNSGTEAQRTFENESAERKVTWALIARVGWLLF